jgi:mono/diheme cytochrome c family protein
MFAAVGIVSCLSPKGKRYDIAGSKTYEASLFRQNCAVCHGPEGEGKTLEDGRLIPNLRDGEHKFTTDGEIYNHIAEGGNGMTPFRDQLSERELRMMVEFVVRDLRAR